jgi:hypothetical protein
VPHGQQLRQPLPKQAPVHGQHDSPAAQTGQVPRTTQVRLPSVVEPQTCVEVSHSQSSSLPQSANPGAHSQLAAEHTAFMPHVEPLLRTSVEQSPLLASQAFTTHGSGSESGGQVGEVPRQTPSRAQAELVVQGSSSSHATPAARRR